MSKIIDNGEIRDMTPEEQAKFDKDQAAPKPEEPLTMDEVLSVLEAALNR